jgi:hypothetical protein
VTWGADEHLTGDYENGQCGSTVAVLTTELSVCSLSSSNSTLILDSGASVSVVSPHLYSNLHNIRRPTSSQVATAADGHSLSISAEGELGPLIAKCTTIRHNCISISQLCDQGYTIIAFNSNFY